MARKVTFGTPYPQGVNGMSAIGLEAIKAQITERLSKIAALREEVNGLRRDLELLENAHNGAIVSGGPEDPNTKGRTDGVGSRPKVNDLIVAAFIQFAGDMSVEDMAAAIDTQGYKVERTTLISALNRGAKPEFGLFEKTGKRGVYRLAAGHADRNRSNP
jgi:hypothetical protein